MGKKTVRRVLGKCYRLLIYPFVYKKEKERTATIDKFGLKSFLPEALDVKLSCKDYSTDKVKVIMLHYNPAFWFSMQSLYDAFSKDPRFDVKVMVLSSKVNNVEHQMEELGINWVKESEYDIVSDEPDIMIHSMIPPRSEISILSENNFKFKYVTVYMTGLSFSTDLNAFYSSCQKSYFRFSPATMAFDRLTYNQIKSYEHETEYIEMGNPLFDGLYDYTKKPKYVGKFEKLKGKKSFLWASDHGIYGNKIKSYCTFDIYAKPLFDYAKTHSDVGLIVRPHPTFILDMIKMGFWSHEDIERIKLYCNDSPNIVWDDDSCFFPSYCVADGFLVDACTSMSVSALPLGKPICALYRSSKEHSTNNRELLDHLYSADNGTEAVNFIQNVVDGIDPMKSERLAAIDRCITAFDGKNGERMKEYVYREFMKKITEIR